ncbi:MAG TPA: choice-of-anchor D domain-containing protein [Candidatus Acidoferrales bacterium]|nr:choice-of-anchor D domain-containing protein [Candidatus Acidoferrales bacterium]
MAKRYWVSLFALCASAGAILSHENSHLAGARGRSLRPANAAATRASEHPPLVQTAPGRPFSVPLAFEPSPRPNRNGLQFIARGAKMDVALTRQGIELAAASSATGRAEVVSLRFLPSPATRDDDLDWRGLRRLPGRSNYLLGNNPAKWRTHVPHFARVEANVAGIGFAVHAHGQGIEYDLQVPPGADASKIRLAISGARNIRLDSRGDLLMRVGDANLRMQKPTIYEEVGLDTERGGDRDPIALESTALSQSKFTTRSRSAKGRGSSTHRTRSPRTYHAPRTGHRRSGRPRGDRPKRIRVGDSNRQSRRRETVRRRSRRRRPKSSENPSRPNQPVAAAQTAAAHPDRRESPQSAEARGRRPVDGGYVLEADGTIGFRVARRGSRATLVIDPTISLVYSSFLGGMGNETAATIAADSAGKIYFAGTTTSPSTFPEAATASSLGPGIPPSSGSTGTAREFFVAKLDPAQSGANSLVYLTFLGGSADQVGGLIAVDAAGDVALTGTTTSTDYPVTDSSARTSGANSTVLTKLDPAGSNLLYSTLFGASGMQSQQAPGGIAIAQNGNIYVASDTNSSDLPATAGAYATAYTSPITDGFLAVFQPGATPALVYCTYLGLNGQVGVGGIAVDASGDAYIAGFTSDPNADFPSKNAVQSVYQGGALDAFVMKIAPAANGPADLLYATLLGGNGSDQAFAVAVDSASPPDAYVTGTTSSTNFPTSGAVAAYQSTLPSNATSATSDAFVSVITQNATTGQTSLGYSTYLGGSQTDVGRSIVANEPYAVYVTGTANSWDFPWRDNVQPFNGYGDAFVAKLDTTTPAVGSLVYSTPLGGTSPAGLSLGSQGSATAVDASGNVWLAGQTESLDFPSAGNPGNGFQIICGSCQESPVAADAFVAEIQENVSEQLPSLYFAAPGIPLNFGRQAIGATTVPPQFAAVKNGGEAPLTISSIAIEGPNHSDFSLSSASGCTAASISPGGLCSFEVSFIPGVAGAEEAFVQVTSDAPGSPQVLEVVGMGAGLASSPGGINFGKQVAGTTSAPQSVTLTNTSNESLYIDSIAEAGPNVALFAPASTAQQCVASAGGMLPGSSCLVDITFSPTASGTFTAEVDIQYHLSTLPEQLQAIPLSGTGVAAAPVAAILPAALDFGTATVGTTTGAQVVTLTNKGSVALDLTSVSLSGTNASDFSIVATDSSPCPSATGSIAINASCTVGVQFAPQTAGTKSAALTFVDDASGSPQAVPLTGTAQPPPAGIQISPSSLTFAAQAVGTKSAAQQITIANNGGGPLAISGISLAGTNSTDFSQTDNCPPSLAANANCVINVIFAPASPGSRSASLRVADNANGSPQQIALIGSATQAGVTLSSASINFGNQAVGMPSAAVTVTVTSSGNGTLAVSGVSVSGTNAKDFGETDDCSGSAASNGIAPSGTCAIQITFKPACGTAAAARNATLSLADNAPGSPQNVTLDGTGTGAFCFLVPSGSSMSASVSPGQTGNYGLQVEAANGFTGNVNLACAGAPSAATCAIAPATVNVGGSELAALQVSVATSAGTAASIWRGPGDVLGGRPGWPLPLALLALASLTALVLAWPGLPGRDPCGEPRFHGDDGLRVRRFAVLAGATCALAIALIACGGGSAAPSTPSDPATPPGTYMITVTGATSTGASQSITLSLTVQ